MTTGYKYDRVVPSKTKYDRVVPLTYALLHTLMHSCVNFNLLWPYITACHPILLFYFETCTMLLLQLLEYCQTYNSAKEFLRNNNIFRRDIPACDICGRQMTEVKAGRENQLQWRCPSHKGNKISLLQGSFLEKHKVSIQDFILLMYLCLHEVSVTTAKELVGVCRQTAVQWYSYFRDVCSYHLVENPITIGGPGVIIQIDESLMAKRKAHQGCMVPERWVFGGIDPIENIGFICFVNDRSAATLLPLIEQFIWPGSEIHSNEWVAYHNIANIAVNPCYVHQTVNHSENFVDPRTGTTTNAVECMWKNCKQKFKSMLGVHSTMLPGHLDEFLWWQQFGRTHDDAFTNLMRHIAE